MGLSMLRSTLVPRQCVCSAPDTSKCHTKLYLATVLRGVAFGKTQQKEVLLAAAGTGGKTTRVVETVVQEVGRGSRVLVAAASNIAVDHM